MYKKWQLFDWITAARFFIQYLTINSLEDISQTHNFQSKNEKDAGKLSPNLQHYGATASKI